MKVDFELAKDIHVGVAVDLVMTAFSEEKKAVPFLPGRDEYHDMLTKRLMHLFTNGSGVVAIQGNKVVGFLAGYGIEEFFGKCKGIYIPVHGHGVIPKKRKQIYQNLYQYASDIWVRRGYLNHAITLFAHDLESIDTWFWLGFGLRCVDAIREVSSINVNNSVIQIKKADRGDIPSLAGLHQKHNLYYRKSPIYMPNQDKDPILDLTEWLEKDNHHLWVADINGQPSGYMRIQPTGESFIAEHPEVMNITGAYVEEKYRGLNIASSLLGVIQQWLRENNYKLCGVDFESINIMGSNFWNKYFTPYTYSLVRRIDERILL